MSQHPDATVTLEGIKRQAKRIKRAEQVQHATALDRAAAEAGYSNYAHAHRALSSAPRATPAPPLFKAPSFDTSTLGKLPSMSSDILAALSRIAERKGNPGRNGEMSFTASELQAELRSMKPAADHKRLAAAIKPDNVGRVISMLRGHPTWANLPLSVLYKAKTTDEVEEILVEHAAAPSP